MMRILVFALGLIFLAGTTQAQTVAEADFNDGTLGPDLFVSGGPGGAAEVDLSSGAAVFNASVGGNFSRAYVATVFFNLADNSFNASIDVTVPTIGGANSFFGIGQGSSTAVGGNSFGEPSLGPTAYAVFNASGRDGGQVNFTDFANVGNQFSVTGGVTPVVPDGVVNTIFLDFDVTTGLLTYSAIFDIANNAAGTVTTLGTTDISDNNFDSTNARIFFGGDDGSTFDNFSVQVVPEPGTVALLGFGFLGTFARRRRRA